MATLASSIKQSKPFGSLEQEVSLTMLRVVSGFSDDLSGLVKRQGLSLAQYNVLRILRGAPGGLSCREVGERLVVKSPDVTRLFDRLAGAGLITRERSQTDRRVVTAHLAEAGRAVLAALDAPVTEMHRRHLGGLGEARLRTLLELLAALMPEGEQHD